MTAFSLDPGEDADAIASMNEIPMKMGNATDGQQWWTFTGDFDGDHRTDLAAKSSRVLSGFGNDSADPGGAPFLPFVGDWNADGKADVGLRLLSGRRLLAGSLWHTNGYAGVHFTCQNERSPSSTFSERTHASGP